MEHLKSYSDGFKLKFEKFLTGCDAIEEMGLWDKESYGEMDVFYTGDLVSVIIRLIAADGNFTIKETTYLNDFFGFQYSVEELQEVYEDCGDAITDIFHKGVTNGLTVMKSINEKLAAAYADLLVTACDIIIESDGIIAPSEIETAKKLKALV